jgi:hydroxyacylglutathione hydrolase
MDILTFVNEPVSSNCYLVRDDIFALVIDPGTRNDEELLKYVCTRLLGVEYIILTHEHFDHSAGVNSLREATGAKLVCTAECNEAIQDSRKNYSAYWAEGKPFKVKKADKIVTDGETLNWRGHTLYFYQTPGHSAGSMTIRIDDTALFTGDNYIPHMRTYTNLKGGSKEELQKTLLRYASMKQYEDMRIFPGHSKSQKIKSAHFNEALRGVSDQQFEALLHLK